MILHWFIDCFSITSCYHRAISHKAYELHPVLKAILLVLGAGAMQNSALVWCSDHRRHHSFEDTPRDPYNINQGFFWAHWGWMFLKDPPDLIKNIPLDLKNDKLVQWQHKYYLLIAISLWLGVPTLIGWALGNPLGGFVYGGVCRVFLSSHCTFLINSAAHTFGKKTYSRILTARDNWFLALFTCGEGFHNFHHKFQNDYRNGIKWYHWDPTKWGIELFQRLGLAWNLRKVSDEKIILARMEAQAQDLQSQGISSQTLLESFRLKMTALHEEFKDLQESVLEQKMKDLYINWTQQVQLLKAQSRLTALS